MSAAYRSVSPQRNRPKKTTFKTNPSRRSSGRVVSLQSKKRKTSQVTPSWLRSLFLLQHSSLVLAVCLITASLVTYGMTVYTQQLWSKEYRKLETLQRDERNLVINHESYKNELARQAEKEQTGLVAPKPNQAIFLSPAPERPFEIPPEATPPQTSQKTAPIGY